MPTFAHRTSLPQARDDVFAWHERPGALVRLTPAVLSGVASEPSDGVHDDSTTKLRIMPLPWSGGRIGVPWTARHVDYLPPHEFTDIMASGPMAGWRHRHRFVEAGQGSEIIDEITWELPAAKLRGLAPFAPIDRFARGQVETMLQRMVGYRGRQLRADLAFHAEHESRPLTIAVSGASGLIGTQLVALLGGGGHRVLTLSRAQRRGEDQIPWDPATDHLDPEALREVDVVIHLAGEPIAGRFTPEHKRAVLASRTTSTALLARTLATLSSDGRKRSFIVASAQGIYGADRGDELLDEDDAGGTGFLADVCRAWEAAADPAREAGVRTVHVRTGIVQSAAGGQLALQAPLFSGFLGGPLGDGRQWMSWIGVDDLARMYVHLALSDSVSGPINAAAPHPVTAEEYATTLARVLRRPHALRVPAAGPQVLLGREGAQELALASQRMATSRILATGFGFDTPDLESTLRHVLCR